MRSVPRALLLLLLASLQVTRGARITRGLVGSGYGSASGGGTCKFWCEGGGGQYYCCQTPQQTALQTVGHLPQTSGFGNQGVNNFANNFGHHGTGSSLGNYGASNNFAQQGNSFGSHGSFRPQGTHGGSVALVFPVTSNNLGHQGSGFGSQGSYRPQGTDGSHNANQGFRPVQTGYNSNNNLASITSGVNNFGTHGHQNNNQPQGHPSNFVANPSIVTPLGQNDAISTHNRPTTHSRPTNIGTIGNSNSGFDPNSFAFQGSNQGVNQGINQGSNQGFNQGSNQGINQGSNLGNNQGPTYPFDVRLRPQTPKTT